MKDPIFIIGASRSGTTLIARILNQHSEIHILNETHFFDEFSSVINKELDDKKNVLENIVKRMISIQCQGYYSKKESLDDAFHVKSLLSTFYEYENRDFASLNRLFFSFEATRHQKKWAGDQTPGHIFYIKEILSMYPSAKFICMVRDPRAVTSSQKNKWKASKRFGQPYLEVIRTKLNYHPLTAPLLWKRAASAYEEVECDISEDTSKVICFEELIRYPEREVRSICKFLEITFNSNMLDVSVEMTSNLVYEGKGGFVHSAIDMWTKSLRSTEIYLVEKVCSRYMRKFGYALTGVRPKMVCLLGYLLIWPIHLICAFVFNFSRLASIRKRLIL